jgi:hypothetical protein
MKPWKVSAQDIVVTDPLLIAPVRDVTDMVVIQTAIIGDEDVLCTKEVDGLQLLRRLRS